MPAPSRSPRRPCARYQAALEAGADPTVVTQWINEAQRDREAAQKKLDTPRAVTRKTQQPLTADQIREMTGHHPQLRKRHEDRDRKVEALASVSL